MAPEPFLTLPIRSCRDLVHARHRARQIAQLLRFDPLDTISIAAGALVIADQAKTLLGRARLCFALLDRHLRVFARPACEGGPMSGELLVLSKPLPHDDRQLTADDIAWVVRQVQLLAPTSLQKEIARQNCEVLELLTALRRGEATRPPGVDGSAA